MTLLSLLGLLAAVITTAAYVPQAYQTITTRSTQGLSLPTYVLLFVGTALWTCYGAWLHNWPIIMANGITALLAGIILALKLLEKPAGEGNK